MHVLKNGGVVRAVSIETVMTLAKRAWSNHRDLLKANSETRSGEADEGEYLEGNKASSL
ncbi:hypothetical protein PYCH_01050 [Pyrococcus yayanosii CH1]|uniref:Uncharacterized protein n=1 Tax=Pyrococcus yayanosii (strain CH1 / JCM 16557) TaxID=529709 RepID=F8AFR5_PYRYC|nr:hypothetical protein PYCH_01050 [Pyrococcus yayanosii CH1]